MRRAGRDQLPVGEEPENVHAFHHDLSVSPLLRGFRWIVWVVVAAGVAFAWGAVGPWAGVMLGLLVTGLLIALIASFDQARWRAQDVYAWYQAGRARRWITDTGAPGPTSGRAEAEVWLGAHPRGTVPQIYRAIAASHTGDGTVLAREVRSMPDTTLAQQAWMAWVPAAWAIERTGSADLTPLTACVAELPDGEDRYQLATWLAIVESLRRHGLRDRSWTTPLAERWPGAERVAVGMRFRADLWFGRYVVVVGFVLTTLALVAAGLGTEQIPPEYAKTTFATRGEASVIDEHAVFKALPSLARAVADGTPVSASPLDGATLDRLVGDSLPTFIWETDAISLQPPAVAAGRHVWSVEVLLGSPGARPPVAVVTFDTEGGPAHAYVIDGGVVETLRRALGLPAGAGQ